MYFQVTFCALRGAGDEATKKLLSFAPKEPTETCFHGQEN